LRVGGDWFHALDQPVCGFHAPVTGDQGPHDRAHALLLNNCAEPGAAKTERRAEPAWLCPGGVADGFAAAKQFRARFFRAAEKKIGMGFRVIAKEVAPRGHFFHEGGRFANEFSNEEEGGFGVVAVEEIEKFGSDGGIRAVVKGKRQLASGVCVVTSGSGDERTGLTATSIASLSADPPSLLVCIDRASSSYRAIASLGRFAVNVLAADQRELADRFAGASGLAAADRYLDGNWLVLPSGVSCLAGSVAVLDCELDERIERHTHAIIIGRVRHVLVGAGSGALVSWRGAYDQVGWSADEISRAIGLSPGNGK